MLNQSRQIALTLMVLIVSVSGCQTVPQSQGLLEQQIEGAELSSSQLRSLLNEYVARFSRQVEQTADVIIADQPATEIHRNALLLKSNAISSCFRAAARLDAFGSFLDLWILTIQMQDLLEQQKEAANFGEYQPELIALARSLEFEIREIYQLMGTGIQPGEEFVYEFARTFPINDLFFVRESLSQHHVKGIDEPTREMMVVLADLNRDLEDMQRLSILYGEFLPKQARWHAELMLLDSVNGPMFAGPFRDLTTIAGAATEMSATANRMPYEIERQHLMLWENIRAERMASFEELERMRAQTTEDLSRERELVLAAIQQERIAVTEQLDATVDRSFDRAEEAVRERTDAMANEGQLALERITAATLQGLSILALLLLGLGVLRFLRLSWKSAKPSETQDSASVPLRRHIPEDETHQISDAADVLTQDQGRRAA